MSAVDTLPPSGDGPKPSSSMPIDLSATPPLTLNGAAMKHGDGVLGVGDMEARCGGCTKIIDQESGGVVVAFGSSLWHVDCFRCAKCKDRVSADTNLLLLSDGSPVCGNCSYQCFVCKQAITEEAIMTGDESYHAHCFTCRTCKRRIEELVFAKTSQGIYCMACHNERVAKSRRHAEAKRQRAARKEREREEERRREEALRQNPSPIPQSSSTGLNGNLLASSAPNGANSSPNASPISTSQGRSPDTSPPVGAPLTVQEGEQKLRDLNVEKPPQRAASPMNNRSAENLPLPASPSDSVMTARPRPIDATAQPPARTSSPSFSSSPTQSQPSPTLSSTTSSRGLTISVGVGPVGTSSSASGLGVPTSKADKRRSINPGMTFNMDAQNSTFAVEPRMSPLPPSPLRASFTDLQAEVPLRSPTSPTPSQLGGEGFPFKAGSGSQRAASPDLSALPPGQSSLTDQVPNSRSGNGLNSASEESSPAHKTAPLAIPPRTPVAHSEDFVGSTPRLNAPDLPPMSFSLSDPDFALILSNIDRSPKAATDRIRRTELLRNEVDLDDSPPASPLPDGGLTRSPGQVDMLSSAAEKDASTSRPRSRSPTASGARLSPNDPVPLLRTRQPSAESTRSIASKLGPDSAFATVVVLVANAKQAGQTDVQVDLGLLVGIVAEIENLKKVIAGLRNKYTGAKRTSQQYSEGLTVAGEEYDKELAIRRELEAEVTRLKAQVHSQTARLSVISSDERRAENMRRRSNDLASSLTGLERDISKLRAQRDMALAEVETLHKTRQGQTHDGKAAEGEAEADTATTLGKSLTNKLDTIREQYREELEPLTAQREALQREIADLRETREQFLEESTALAAKNDELVELNSQLSRQAEAMQDSIARARAPTIFPKRAHPSGSPSLSSLATSATLQEVPEETARVVKVTKPEPIEAAPARRFKWYKSSKGPDVSSTSASISRPLALPPDKNRMQRPSTEFGIREHNFTQHSTMRFTRCELCAEKMWGLQEVRCSSCGIVCHSKCAEKLPRSCAGTRTGHAESLDGPLPTSMFGRELAEQAASDKAQVPVIVTKCISAVEAVGMEYEGIYRKTGGSSQSKQITQLFERGDYDSFDLADVETFNDVSSVTSVLKTYFRQLPNPLLTHALHESFVAAASIRDAGNKHTALCALLKELPREHYNTLRTLMLHLNRVTAVSSVNLMTSQNLGVVFGPTLMRSADPNREFGDMAGKALSIQWMVDNAPQVFAEAR